MGSESDRPRAAGASFPIKLAPMEDLNARCKEVHDLIARRAYQLYERRGHKSGEERRDWERAESEVLSKVAVGFMQSDHVLILDAAVPGVDAEHLQVGVEPRRITISGTRTRALGRHSGPLEVFRVVDLPVEVDPQRTTATLRCGVLELVAPKLGAPRAEVRAA